MTGGRKRGLDEGLVSRETNGFSESETAPQGEVAWAVNVAPADKAVVET
jgi:hypothetical protein